MSDKELIEEARGIISRLADALAALATPQEEKSAAKVVTVSYEASASCSHGTCPAGCSHLMWACTACSCEGGWGASRERLEELAAKHECPPAPQEEDTREFVADRVARALDGNGGDDLGEAAGEGALHLALASPIREAIEDVYADCGDSDPRVLSTNIAQRLAYLLPPAILAAFPVLSRDIAGEIEAEADTEGSLPEWDREGGAYLRGLRRAAEIVRGGR